MSKDKLTTVHYNSYLALDEILNAQHPRSLAVEGKMAHDEMLFIIIHQVYELWFKQILHELTSVARMFNKNEVDERNVGVAVSRLDRVVEIQEILIAQIRVLETMTPLDFLDFRNYLFPASGFQSFQFRKVEVLLGLERDQRMTYNEKPYTEPFTEERRAILKEMETGESIFELVEKWLERTPFLEFKNFKFLAYYEAAVDNMLEKEREGIRKSDLLTDQEKEMRLKMIGSADTYYDYIFDEAAHDALREKGELRLSYNATIAALLINLYRDEPILHMPYNLLTRIMDIDELFVTWRYRHAQMVLRMLGKKIGTGGSSGYEYLMETAKKHQIFADFHNISTMLIPRSELPELPVELKRELGFYFTSKSTSG